MIKMLQTTTRKYLVQKNIYVNKFQLQEDAKINFLARKMKTKGLLVETRVNSQGVTLVRKSPAAGLTQVTSLSSLAEFADGRWDEFKNL